EPHYNEISSADQVQIYEAIMATPSNAVTTTLLSAVRYIKDNRLLPRGFDKSSADKDIAVIGAAADDTDFVGGSDHVRYSTATGDAQGPFQIEAELLYQPIAYRWSANLKGYDTVETKRFGGYYDAMSSVSAVRISSQTIK